MSKENFAKFVAYFGPVLDDNGRSDAFIDLVSYRSTGEANKLVSGLYISLVSWFLVTY